LYAIASKLGYISQIYSTLANENETLILARSRVILHSFWSRTRLAAIVDFVYVMSYALLVAIKIYALPFNKKVSGHRSFCANNVIMDPVTLSRYDFSQIPKWNVSAPTSENNIILHRVYFETRTFISPCANYFVRASRSSVRICTSTTRVIETRYCPTWFLFLVLTLLLLFFYLYSTNNLSNFGTYRSVFRDYEIYSRISALQDFCSHRCDPKNSTRIFIWKMSPRVRKMRINEKIILSPAKPTSSIITLSGYYFEAMRS